MSLEVTEDVAIKFSEAQLSLQVYEVNKENASEETLIETIQIDISSILFQTDGVDVSRLVTQYDREY